MNETAAHQMNIVIVGGGTAGWLTAGLLASRRQADGAPCFSVTIIEPPDLPPIGVGEGSWPTMRATLKAIGVTEREFLRSCNVSFKQGSKFIGWGADDGTHYYHPFDPPLRSAELSASEFWLQQDTAKTFSRFSNRQEDICEQHLAPKLVTSPEYAGVLNYGYHFDSHGLAKFLKDHCEHGLGVRMIPDLMTGVVTKENGDIVGVETSGRGLVEGDFFVDCTGFRALLMKGHFGIGAVSLSDILPANRAVTVQVPYAGDAPIQSTTVATAQKAGWIWDVSLANRRGVGYVHSSEYIETDQAIGSLFAYLGMEEKDAGDLAVRELKFEAGHLDKFWVRNCAGIGLAGGFIEPLEASSIMLTEISARALCDALTRNFGRGDGGAAQFNDKITRHWKEIVEFLKLHYVLSERREPFWQDNKLAGSIPAPLQRKLEDWQHGGPRAAASPDHDALFPIESYQYVWHGLRGRAKSAGFAGMTGPKDGKAEDMVHQYHAQTKRLTALLPTNRRLLSAH